MLKRIRLPALLCACALLCGCSALELGGDAISDQPNLGLLQMPAYEESPADAQISGAQTVPGSATRVDLWLGASQLMGGINQSDSELFPHHGRRYREGGFHYRYDGQAGWYESVLRDLLATAEGARTRVMRFGNERIPDAAIASAGLAAQGDADRLRSVRRDLMTYATDPMPTIFAGFSADNMTDSYYSLGASKSNRMSYFAPENGAALENPGRTEEMGALLDARIAAFASGEPGDWAASGDADWPLLYAIRNLDLERLSFIAFDPAEMRRLSATDASGETLRYVRDALSERGVFERGLTVGLYAFELDYMGQMNGLANVDLAVPVVWGKLKYSDIKKTSIGALPMPRVMLALVVGQSEQVDDFTARLNERMDADMSLKGLRGPADGELTYVADGQTVTQQPFSFAYHYTTVRRPTFTGLSQHTAGMTLAADGAEVSADGSLKTVLLSSGAPDTTLTLTLPLTDAWQSMAVDLSALQDPRVEVLTRLTLDETLPNAPDTALPADGGAQLITVRDRVYVYRSEAMPYADKPDDSPFALLSLAPDESGAALVARIAVDVSALSPGYYRLRVAAELSGRQIEWLPVGWIDGADSLDASFANEQIAEWESFSELVRRYDSEGNNVPRQFQHAWGPLSDRSYHGVAFPDFPPVYKAPGLRELMAQLRLSANIDELDYVRCVFDVFVDTGARQ